VNLVQVVEHLPSKPKAMNSNANNTIQIKRKKKKNKYKEAYVRMTEMIMLADQCVKSYYKYVPYEERGRRKQTQ
jgi:hypothetical protein